MTELRQVEKQSPQKTAAKVGHWQWAILSGGLTVAFYFQRWTFLVVAATILTAVTSSIAILSSRSRPTDRPTQSDGGEEEQREFTLSFPVREEDGWHRCTVTPTTNNYVEEACDGGPPITVSTFHYVVKSHHVFAQLLDSCNHSFDGDHFEVVNSQVLETNIKARNRGEWAEEQIESFKKQTQLTEIRGSLRYFILLIHGCDEAFLTKEKRRIDAGFAALASEASHLGGIRDGIGMYKAPADADERTKAEVRALQQDSYLNKFGIAFHEVVNYEHIVETLNVVQPPPKNPFSNI